MKRWICAAAVGLGTAWGSQVHGAEIEAQTSLNVAAQSTDLALYAVESPSTPVPPLTPFDEGQWTFQAYGSATIGGEAGELGAAHVGIGYFVLDGFSLNIEGVAAYVTMDDERGETGHEGFAGGFDLLMRWHFLYDQNWSVYVEGGAGMLLATTSVPADGTHFNFSPQFGFGATFRVSPDLFLMAGARWQHISNLNKDGDDRNPGYDGVLVYLGVMVPF